MTTSRRPAPTSHKEAAVSVGELGELDGLLDLLADLIAEEILEEVGAAAERDAVPQAPEPRPQAARS